MLYFKNGFKYELIVADGGSNDGTLQYLYSLGNGIRIVEQGKLIGVVRTLNQCIKICDGNYVFPVADDTIIIPNTIQNICSFMDRHKQFGMVGPKMQETKYNNLHNVFNWVKPFYMVTPKSFIIRKTVLEEIGFLDEGFRTYYIDVDLPLTVLSKGYSVCVSREVGVIHKRIEDVNVKSDDDFVYINKSVERVKI